MKFIEIGSMKLHVDNTEEMLIMVQTLNRPLQNQEIATLLEISVRTVARWKHNGSLPSGNIISLSDIIIWQSPKRK